MDYPEPQGTGKTYCLALPVPHPHLVHPLHMECLCVGVLCSPDVCLLCPQCELLESILLHYKDYVMPFPELLETTKLFHVSV